jgi:hypothetical protein
MKVAIVRGGGVAGLTTKTQLDSKALTAADADALEARVREGGLLAQQEGEEPRPRHPDELLYAVTVDTDGETRTHSFAEEELPDEVRSLVEWVDVHPEREHAVERPGGASAP